MTKQITKTMCEEFNEILSSANRVARLRYQSDSTVEIQIVQDAYVNLESTTLYPSDILIDKIKDFFASKGIQKVHFNNSSNSFWAVDDN